MFTGIIEEVGAVARRSGADLTVVAQTVLDGIAMGDSIAINGVCMTVVEFTEESFTVQVSPETAACTTLNLLRAGDGVNLERAMAAGERFGGHFVLGHVDGVGRIESVEDQGDFSLWRFQVPPEVAAYLVPKGSAAVDGISLTVVDPSADSFYVAVIPATIQKTTFQTKRPGDRVNLEADMIGKHIVHYLKNMGSGSPVKSGLTRDLLKGEGLV